MTRVLAAAGGLILGLLAVVGAAPARSASDPFEAMDVDRAGLPVPAPAGGRPGPPQHDPDRPGRPGGRPGPGGAAVGHGGRASARRGPAGLMIARSPGG